MIKILRVLYVCFFLNQKFLLFFCIALIVSYNACGSKKDAVKNSGTSSKYAKMANERFGLQNFYILDFAQSANGQVSAYGSGHKRTTASGEQYDEKAYSAAHKSLPFNTIVRITNIANGKSSSVRINDRLDKNSKNVLVISKAAADELDMSEKFAHIEIKIVAYALCSNDVIKVGKDCLIVPTYQALNDDEHNEISTIRKQRSTKNKDRDKDGTKLISKDYSHISPDKILVQIGAYRYKANALSLLELNKTYMQYSAFMERNKKTKLYEVFLRGFESVDEARAFIHTPAFCDDFVIVDGKVIEYSKNICRIKRKKTSNTNKKTLDSTKATSNKAKKATSSSDNANIAPKPKVFSQNGEYFVQVGAYRIERNANEMIEHYSNYKHYKITSKKMRSGLIRVMLSGFKSLEEAIAVAKSIDTPQDAFVTKK